MIIIANPPYGYKNSLVKQIIKKVVPLASSTIMLCPKNTYKDTECLRFVEMITLTNETFDDAAIQDLTIAKLSRNAKGEQTLEDLMLDKKLSRLCNAVQLYNKSHETHWGCISEKALLAKWSKSVFDVTINKLSKDVFKKDVTLNEALENRQLFLITKWSPQDGVHVNDAHDWNCNLNDDWSVVEGQDYAPGYLFVFPNNEERDNFRDWWYSCLKVQNGKKQRVGLTNAFLDIVNKIVAGCGVSGCINYFPNLDWSHPWTDEEILAELGFLEPRKFN